MQTKNLGIKSSAEALSTNLAYRIREDILTGVLKNEQKLTEQNICDQYRVSRTPVREALVKLEVEGLIDNIPNRGAFVHSLSEQDMADIFAMRSIYEIQATTWAIERITDQELDELEENFEFMEFYTMKKDIGKMLNINRNFHQIIYRASHNRMLAGLLNSYQMYVKHNPDNMQRDEDYLATVLEEHRTIFKAFKDKDPEAGAKAMKYHMDMTFERYLKYKV